MQVPKQFTFASTYLVPLLILAAVLRLRVLKPLGAVVCVLGCVDIFDKVRAGKLGVAFGVAAALAHVVAYGLFVYTDPPAEPWAEALRPAGVSALILLAVLGVYQVLVARGAIKWPYELDWPQMTVLSVCVLGTQI
jgi:hypothetical protein